MAKIQKGRFLINFKYSNNDYAPFQTVDVSKRKNAARSSVVDTLQLLYPNGHKVDVKKKKNLLELSEYIPPRYLDFYQNLKTTADPSEDFIEIEEDDAD